MFQLWKLVLSILIYTTHAHTHTQPYSESTLTLWKGLLIDQSALTAVWRELLTLWLQRVCVQWPCKGSLALTLGVSALPRRRWCAHTRTHTYVYTHAGGTSIPRQSPSGMHSHRAVSVCIQSGGGDTSRFFLPWLCTGPACILALAPPSLWSQGEQVQHTHSWNTD